MHASERGFTLVELLVVILIVGILAMIALPSFIGQRMKGEDTEAQQMVRTVATALAVYHTDHDTYDATRAELVAIEPAVGGATADLVVDGEDDGYEITERSATNTEFTMERASDGDIRRSCTVPGRGLCNGVGEW